MAKRAAKFPNRKISETLLHFASLTPDALPSEAPERRALAALAVACTVWNAVAHAQGCRVAQPNGRRPTSRARRVAVVARASGRMTMAIRGGSATDICRSWRRRFGAAT